MKNARVWLFRVLVIAAAGFMVWTWFQPWWICDVAELSAKAVVIHPWGLEEDLGGFVPFALARAQMPGWFAPLMWFYLASAIGLILFSLWLKGRKGKIALSLVGLSYIAIAVGAVIFATIRLKSFFGGIPLQGVIEIDLGEPMIGLVETSLKLGYYLTYAAGFLLIVLALLRDKISGRKLT